MTFILGALHELSRPCRRRVSSKTTHAATHSLIHPPPPCPDGLHPIDIQAALATPDLNVLFLLPVLRPPPERNRQNGVHQANHHPGLQEVGRMLISDVTTLTRHITAIRIKHRSSPSLPRAMSSLVATAQARVTSSLLCASSWATTTTT